MVVSNQIDTAANDPSRKEETHDDPQSASPSIASDYPLFLMDAVAHLTLGHAQESVRRSRDDAFIRLQHTWRRKGA